MRNIIGLSVAAVILCSCASAPRTRHPTLEATPPSQWTAGKSGRAPSDSLWWAGFGDPAMDSTIAEALARNPNLQAAAGRLHAAAAQAKIAGAPLAPQVGAGFSASRRKQNFLGYPLPGATGVVTSTSTSYGVSLDVAWEIDLWGRLSAGKAAALADYQAARAEFSGARLSLAAQTAKVWFAAVEARRQVELSRATVDNLKTSRDLVRARYERGLRPSLDLRLSLATLAGAEALFQQRQVIFDRTVRQLEIILGRYPSAALLLSDDLPPLPDSIPAGLPADLVARRPDLVAAERRLAASLARVKLARRSLYPRISLTASTGRSSQELGDLLKGDFGVWALMANLTQPLFQGGRIRGNIDLARSQSEQSLALYGQSVLGAYAEVESALASEGYLSDMQAALETAAEQSVAARHLAEDRYATGLTDLITLLEAQRRAYDSESQLLAVRRQRLENRIDLHLALGGGFAGLDRADAGADTTSTLGANLP
ncbi:MAG: efflux transporter outer membrane subunit [Candidatus Latescibacteria bacterium]|nr:efflux transporter outer membrane subunit [Candidatus Latescibacterota bacterium]